MVNYDIIKELNDIKTRMYGTHLEQDRIVIEDAINLIEETKKAIEIVQKIPNIIKILENYKDPNPQNLYGMQKNVHYNDAIILLNDLIG